jgi:hypothetical protein
MLLQIFGHFRLHISRLKRKKFFAKCSILIIKTTVFKKSYLFILMQHIVLFFYFFLDGIR